jgi:ABC-type multidrug transport system fused ATPase/permease subunit
MSASLPSSKSFTSGSASTCSNSSGYQNANVFSRLFNTWLNPLLGKGNKRPLEYQDIYELPDEFTASFIFQKFGPNLDAALEQRKSLVWALWRTYGTPFVIAGLLKAVADVCSTSAPKTLWSLIDSIEKRESLKAMITNQQLFTGYFFCVVIYLLLQVNIMLVNSYFLRTMSLGFKCRVALANAIYRKCLGFSPAERHTFTSGKVTNMISNDTSRVERAVIYFHYVWSGPFQILMIVSFLWSLLGWISLIGLGIFCLFYPIQSFLMNRMTTLRNSSSSITDSRVKKMQEIIAGMRIIKFNSWEEEFLTQLGHIRTKEMGKLFSYSMYRSWVTFVTTMGPIISCCATFATYYFFYRDLPIKIVLPSIAYFNSLRLPLALLPMVLSLCSDSKVALKRMQDCLESKLGSYQPEQCKSNENSVEIEQGVFFWPSDRHSRAPTANTAVTAPHSSSPGGFELSDDEGMIIGVYLGDITIKKGELVAIVGATGSGKTTFLNCLIGEMFRQQGNIRVASGPIAYCPQTAWIRNSSIRNNILLGSEFDLQRYYKVVTACQMIRDFELLTNGDETLIGDRGTNLSGGQKHRISMARAAYSESSLLLFDDPLAALDANVRKKVWRQLFREFLKNRTRLVCTHDEWILPSVDRIISLNDMRVEFNGSYQDFLEFRKIIAKSDVRRDSLTASTAQLPEEIAILTKTPSPAPPSTPAAEDRAIGKVSFTVFTRYFIFCGGLAFIIAALLSVILHQLTRIGDNYWVINWKKRNIGKNLDDVTYFLIYIGWGFAQGIFSYIGALVFSIGGLKSSREHHNIASRGVIYTPISFVERNPSGRILNRFSKDIDALDGELPEDLRSFLSSLGFVLAAFGMIIIASWTTVVFLTPLFLLSVYLQSYYRNSMREIKRLESASRSPLFSNLSETFDGLTSIKAYRYQDQFVGKHEHSLDHLDKCSFLLFCTQRWIAIRLESIGNSALLVACVFVFATAATGNSGISGVALVQSLMITGALNWALRQFAEAESRIISSERLLQYGELPSEEGAMTSLLDQTISSDWPSRGEIVAKDVCLRYIQGGPLALNDMSLHIQSKEKIGVVGRTGAGKSTLIASLYRLYDYESGSLKIDGVELKELGLKRLRTALTIIPQDPIIFSGSIRSNLDPLGRFRDEDLWRALALSYLKEHLLRLSASLDTELDEAFSLSAGQKQLLCLARALLHKTPIVVLDEATANIDHETDAQVQHCLRREFANSTVITVAHRIGTVLGYDRVFCFEAGSIVEVGEPSKLMADESSRFYALAKEMQ